MKLNHWMVAALCMPLMAMAAPDEDVEQAAGQGPAECADRWQAGEAYPGGSIASHDGRNYRAHWWTRDEAPGAAVWQDAGACRDALSRTFTLASDYVKTKKLGEYRLGNRFDIEVRLPRGYRPNRSYPVLYVLDWFILRNAVLAQLEEVGGQMAPVIIVGVGCHDDEATCWLRRERDYTPTWRADEDAYIGNTDPAVQISGGGPDFLSFLTKELAPRIERRYRTDVSQRGVHGTSLSGLLAAHALTAKPGYFSKMALNSPAVWYDDALVPRALAQAAIVPVKRVVVTQGDQDYAEIRESVSPMVQTLSVLGVDVSLHELAGQTHETAPGVASSVALPLLYPR
ncbi:alpha/beta hydrolase-fold protein [Chitinibacteraceae bacterium HSL-7]